jgi:hypothetical protein
LVNKEIIRQRARSQPGPGVMPGPSVRFDLETQAR